MTSSLLRTAPRFLAENPSLALFALLATGASGFGQTFFLGLFGDQLRSTFMLSYAAYGLYYSLATLLSAALLLKFGGLIDRWQLSRVTLLAVCTLAAGCIALATAQALWMLCAGFLLVRFGGQAMLSHIGMTTAGRYFSLHRGKVVAFTASGFSLSEALLPLLFSIIIAFLGWRSGWLIAAALLVIVLLPIMLALSRNAIHPQAAHPVQPALHGWTRSEVLRHAGFYCFLPASIAVPFIVTALFFHQNAIADMKSWTVSAFAQGFIAYGSGHFVNLLATGGLIDRFSAKIMLPVALIPLMAGLAALGLSNTPWLFLGLLGMSQGAINATLGALWPEQYGVKHIGAIRSVMQAIMVLSTAIAPIAMGLLLDAQITLKGLVLIFSCYTAGAAALAALPLYFDWARPNK